MNVWVIHTRTLHIFFSGKTTYLENAISFYVDIHELIVTPNPKIRK